MFNCVTCGKVYVHKRALNRHAKIHDGSTNSCGICHKTFSRWSNLSIHVQNHHSKYIEYYIVEPEKTSQLFIRECKN